MLRSLYSGVSGLQNHQTRMDVIGNNIANVNTIGFKKGRVTFQDMISQTQSGAAKPDERLGGVNPKQVGLGMKVAAIDTIQTQGSLQSTGIKTDLAIQGEGFFIVKNGEESFYTRAGAFSLDSEGVLVDPATGMRVQGWQSDANGDTNLSGQIGKLNIPVGDKLLPKATGEVRVRCNLNKNTPIIQNPNSAEDVKNGTWKATYEIYDSFGNPEQITVDYVKATQQGDNGLQEVPNQWIATVNVLDLQTNQPTPINLQVGGVANADGNNQLIVTFNNDGSIATLQNAEGGNVNTGQLAAQVNFQVPRSAAGADGNPYTQNFNLVLGTSGESRNGATLSTSESTNKIYYQDGYTLGYLSDFNIDSSGTITGVYSNGEKKSLGRIALASFTNPGGLDKVGDTAFRETPNSGQVDVGPSNTAGKGILTAGALEMSNVDLSEMFTDMIVTQRGFQSNSKTIQTSDQILQELLTLKR